MAFKLKPPYEVHNTPIYQVDMEEGVLGMANNNGTNTYKQVFKPESM